MVYAGDVKLEGENIGMIIISVDVSGFSQEKSPVQNQIFFLANKENIDIAILDIRMPGVNGLELCERLRQMNEHIQWRYFTVRGVLRLCNYIFSISITQDKEDYYIYSVEQLVNTYKDFQEILCQMKAFLQEHTEEVKKDEAFTNVAFMKLMKYINEK